MECLQRKRADWTFRIKQEVKNCYSAYFVTLTYNDTYMPVDGMLVKKDLQLFLKRLRQDNERKLKREGIVERGSPVEGKVAKLTYYATGEYGEHTKRPHYHLIIFNLEPDYINDIEKVWGKGFVKIGEVNDASIHYVTKYVINRSESESERVPFALMSHKIGIEYLRENVEWHKSGLKNYVISSRGFKQALPRYYSDKVFNFGEKQLINERNIERLAEIESNEISRFDGYEKYFEDRFQNRKQVVKKFSKHNKKDKL